MFNLKNVCVWGMGWSWGEDDSFHTEVCGLQGGVSGLGEPLFTPTLGFTQMYSPLLQASEEALV